jgi:YspA, cpYpsA-related SLOG family
MKVLVCGGRDYTDGARVHELLSKLHDEQRITCIVTGAARGADELAQAWAVANRVSVARYPANWKEHGKSAGPRRNKIMLETEKPQMVVAFPGGKGTKDMVVRADAARVSVLVVTR